MQVLQSGSSVKLYEMKQKYAFKNSVSKNNIQSFMLLSNPLISNHLKTKYSDVMSNAVSSFLDHYPKDEKFTAKSSISKQRLLNKKKEIFNVLNSSHKENQKTLLSLRRNNPFSQSNPFNSNSNSLAFKPNCVNMMKKSLRNSSMDESSSSNMIRRIKELSLTANIQFNSNKNNLMKKKYQIGMFSSGSMKNLREYLQYNSGNENNNMMMINLNRNYQNSCEDRGLKKIVFNEQLLKNDHQQQDFGQNIFEKPLSDRKEKEKEKEKENNNNVPDSSLYSTILRNDNNTNESSCEINIYNNLIENYIN